MGTVHSQEIQIRIPRAAKIHKAAAKNPGRYAFQYVAWEPPTEKHGPCLVATDGRKMAVVPCEVEMPADATQQLLPQSVIKEATKGTGKKPDHGLLQIDSLGEGVVGGLPGKAMLGDKLGDTAVCAFPRWEQVVDHMPTPKDERGKVKVGLNAKYLLELAQAIGAEDDQIILTIEPEPQQDAGTKAARNTKAIRIDACSGVEGAYAYLMPVHVG